MKMTEIIMRIKAYHYFKEKMIADKHQSTAYWITQSKGFDKHQFNYGTLYMEVAKWAGYD